MADSIVPTQTNLPGVELIYLSDRDVAGIHYRGLAQMLDCHPQTVSNAAETVNIEDVVELEIQTPQGLRTVKFLLEQGVIQVLKKIRRSNRIKKETRENAEDLYDRFAMAGFKLYTMLKVAPEVLKEKVDRIQQTEPEIEKPILQIAPAYEQAMADLKLMNAAADMFIEAGVDPLLAKTHALSQLARLHPGLAPQFTAMKLLVPQQSEMQSADIYLNPTDIGLRFNPPMSARQINSMLILQGFQVRIDKKDIRYELTEKGKKHGKVTLNQAANATKTVQHIKWKASIVDALQGVDRQKLIGE